MEIKQYFPHPGWVEIDPNEIVDTINECIREAIKQLEESGRCLEQIKAVGIANQRGTCFLDL